MITGIAIAASPWFRACSRRASSCSRQIWSSSGRSAHCTIRGRVATRAAPAALDATVSARARARRSATIAMPKTAPGTRSTVPGGEGTRVRADGVRLSMVPTALRARPSAPRPTWAPWRSTSPAFGGAAGTGCAFGTTVFPCEVTAEW